MRTRRSEATGTRVVWKHTAVEGLETIDVRVRANARFGKSVLVAAESVRIRSYAEYRRGVRSTDRTC